MKYLFIFSFVLLGFTTISSGGEEEKNGKAEDIEAKEMAKVLDKEGIIILDVRTPGETARGKIPGAIEIDFRGANFEKEVEKLDKDKPVYIYCASGGRSKKAQGIMSKAGFKETYNLLGGFGAWSSAGLPTE